jgi:hypothetical protein
LIDSSFSERDEVGEQDLFEGKRRVSSTWLSTITRLETVSEGRQGAGSWTYLNNGKDDPRSRSLNTPPSEHRIRVMRNSANQRPDEEKAQTGEHNRSTAEDVGEAAGPGDEAVFEKRSAQWERKGEA